MIIKNFLKTAVLGIALLDISSVMASPDVIAQVRYEINNEINESIKKPEFNNPEMNEINSECYKKAQILLKALNMAESEFIDEDCYNALCRTINYFVTTNELANMKADDSYYTSNFNCHDPFLNLRQYIINNQNNIKNMLKILKGRIDPNEQW